MEFKNNLYLVSMESPKDNWDNDLVKHLFHQMVALKFDGYSYGYDGLGYKVLPVDGSDFIGVHELVCKEEGDKLVPIMGYRSISVGACKEYNQRFPLISGVATSKSKKHIDAVEESVAQFEKSGLSVWYDSSFTIDPRVKQNVELEHYLYELLFAIVGWHRITYCADRTFVLANEGFKTDKLFQKMGSKILVHQGEELESLVLPYSGYNKHKILLCNRDFSMKSRRYMKNFKDLWESRMIIGDRSWKKKVA